MFSQVDFVNEANISSFYSPLFLFYNPWVSLLFPHIVTSQIRGSYELFFLTTPTENTLTLKPGYSEVTLYIAEGGGGKFLQDLEKGQTKY